jgi:hypothetical protein
LSYWVIHCDISKSAYNISYLNSPSPSLFPSFLEEFQQVYFSNFMHEYILFPPYSLSYTLSLYCSLSHWYQNPDWTWFTFLSSIFEKKRHFCLTKTSIQIFIMTFPCIYVLYPELVYPSIFSFLPLSSSYDEFNKFKNSTIILV